MKRILHGVWMVRTATLAALMLAGCAPPEPVKLGFMAALSGRAADVGLAGRDGALLAVERRNQKGGINGRPVELVVRDDGAHADTAVRAIDEFATARIEAVIGPMFSSIAVAVLPAAEKAGLLLVSPTVTTTQLSGKDDAFLRVISSTGVNARRTAEFHVRRQNIRRIAVAYDTSNAAYTESWLSEFAAALAELGGSVVTTVAFQSGQGPGAAEVVRRLMSHKSEALLFIANAVDTVHLAQQARKQGYARPLVGVEWAATESLVELGGRTVEGMHLAQFFDRNDPAPAYQEFRREFKARFRQEPGFASVAGYDATVAVLDALARRGKGQSLKDALLTLGPFPGAQQQVAFDRFGDATRDVRVTVVRDGRFVAVD